MVYTIKAGAVSIPIVDTTGGCKLQGVKIASLDGNGTVYLSLEQGSLDKLNSTTNHPNAGFLLQQLATPTNIPSVETFAPFKGVIYARNYGAADSDISVEVFDLE